MTRQVLTTVGIVIFSVLPGLFWPLSDLSSEIADRAYADPPVIIGEPQSCEYTCISPRMKQCLSKVVEPCMCEEHECTRQKIYFEVQMAGGNDAPTCHRTITVVCYTWRSCESSGEDKCAWLGVNDCIVFPGAVATHALGPEWTAHPGGCPNNGPT